MGVLGGLGRRFDAIVWQPEIERLHGPRRWLLVALRILITLIEDFRNGEITMRAMGLVYTTLVSLVPLLALAFSLLKAFGVDNALRPVLQRFLAPLGAGSGQIIDKIVDFVQNVQVGVLGAIGVVTLLYSVISLIQKVEAGCNYIWHVRKPRSIGRRVTEYISVLVAGPLIILAAASITATVGNNSTVSWLTSIEPFGAALYLAGHILPYILYSIGFTVLFKYIPNTRVRLLPALGGGVFSGVLWQTASLGFALFAKNAGNVNAIYSSFAILILLLIWLYVSWMILLLGCRVAFLLQHNERLTRGHYPPRLGAAERERLALLVTTLVADRFMQGGVPWTIPALAHTLRSAPDHVQDIADQLIAGGLFIEAGELDATLLPRRDIAEVRVSRVLDIVRAGEPAARAQPRDVMVAQTVDALTEEAEQAKRSIFRDRSLRDMALLLHDERESVDRRLPTQADAVHHATRRQQI
ncbi:YihY/virulence factor BrkB family protein [Salinisphaera hydrothermalis]|uniref:YihY/virulence factor BrkB family protein n=1 Tax=Salinisphaera hydrothermalis TaxID=563188 RepID=UPI003341EBD7